MPVAPVGTVFVIFPMGSKLKFCAHTVLPQPPLSARTGCGMMKKNPRSRNGGGTWATRLGVPRGAFVGTLKKAAVPGVQLFAARTGSILKVEGQHLNS